ncbi:uncharacterized protein TNCV_2599431 [Trichonephila clavipes]|uniref:Pre-C2HC domain-containing protein n=1 Tax=Trichonephila clavipes TaxID=2585209 RepID=A0A8X6RFX3_TRICX|nr:uncharacterized protein TNCV_2599431 [Trichonephila clavipes]
MSNMETDAPISITDCTERLRICAKIEGHDIVANNYEGLDNLPDTAENQEMEILRAALKETLRKKADLVKEPIIKKANQDSKNSTDILKEEPIIKKANQDSKNSTDNATTSKINKKRKIKKDSLEDFVFAQKTPRPVSPLIIEEDKTIETPKPNSPPSIHLMIKENIRDQLKITYQKLTNKTSGKFIKLLANDNNEYHELTHTLEDPDFEFYVIKPKINKSIKIVIKGLPSFTKIQDITTDLEEQGFRAENFTRLISKKTKAKLPFYQVTVPRNANNLKNFDLKSLGYMQIRVEGFLLSEESHIAIIVITSITRQKTATLSPDALNVLTPNSQSKPLTLSKVPATPLITDIETTPNIFIHAGNTRSTLFPDKGRRDMNYPSAYYSYKSYNLCNSNKVFCQW